MSDRTKIFELWDKAGKKRYGLLHTRKFGDDIEDGKYLLTNLRALVNDIGLEASKEFYNTDPDEIAIIKKHFKVFKHKMDMISARQFMRHTTAVWQELSRRYVSGKKVPFEFYVSESMKNVKWTKTLHFSGEFGSEWTEKVEISTQQLINDSIEHYFQALKQGVKPQQARYIIHPCVYTEIWSGWQPFALENMFTERTAIGTQWELRQTAIAMQELIKEEKKIC
jgi:thymidylate synthase (FAD)